MLKFDQQVVSRFYALSQLKMCLFRIYADLCTQAPAEMAFFRNQDEEDPFEAFDMRVSRPSIQTSQQISEVKSIADFANAHILARNAYIL